MDKRISFGPMSSEIIEAVFRYSHINHVPTALIASKNQIDYDQGYVNNWSTQQYMNFIYEMRRKYQDSNVIICRDHCGPGFNGIDDVSDVFKTISNDIRSGFDLIHIDFCHYPGARQASLEKAAVAIKFAQKLNPNIRFEVGTDEINQPLSLGQLRRDLEFFTQICSPEYFVVNTGSLVLEDYQAGIFNTSQVQRAKQCLEDFGIQLKEHNADYLSSNQIRDRIGLVDGMNVAPELGVRQTEKILDLASKYKVPPDSFLTAAYKSKKWKKWLQYSSPDDKYLCSILAGHYVFNSKEYLKLYKHLQEFTDVKEELIETAMLTIHRYYTNFYYG